MTERKITKFYRPLFCIVGFFLLFFAPLQAFAASVNLSWNASTDNVGVAGYNILRSQAPGGPYAPIGISAVTSYSDTTVSPSTTYYYVVQAYDAAGNTSPYSNEASITTGPPPDTTPPTVTITSPVEGAVVSGAVQVSANASDDVGVFGVQFQLDGVDLGAEDVAAPYAVTWNTPLYGNGAHVLTAIARDTTGNTAVSPAVNVTVGNGIVAPIPVSGKIGSAFLFNGVSNYAFLPVAGGSFNQKPFTLLLWVSSTAPTAGIFATGDSPFSAGGYLYAGLESGRPVMKFSDDALTAPNPISQGWVNIAFVWEGPGQKRQIYVNGALTAEDTPNPSKEPVISFGTVTDGGAWLGKGYDGVAERFLEGAVDEFRYYGRALTLREVAAQYRLIQEIYP